MIFALVKAALGITIILGGWLMTDLLWQRMFGAKSRRTGCHGCTCSSPCSTPSAADSIHDPEHPNESGER